MGLLSVKDDLLAMSANLTKKMEKVAETGSNFLSAGKDAVSDVKGVLNRFVSLSPITSSSSRSFSREAESLHETNNGFLNILLNNWNINGTEQALLTFQVYSNCLNN